VDNCSEASLALDDDIGDTHFAAQGREVDNQLNGVNIVRYKNQRSLFVLNQSNDVVETVLDNIGLFGNILLLLAILDGLSLLDQTLLLLGLGLRAVLVEETEGLGSQVLIGGVLELGECRRNLQAHVEDLLLALKADIFGPFHETR